MKNVKDKKSTQKNDQVTRKNQAAQRPVTPAKPKAPKKNGHENEPAESDQDKLAPKEEL